MVSSVCAYNVLKSALYMSMPLNLHAAVNQTDRQMNIHDLSNVDMHLSFLAWSLCGQYLYIINV